MLKAIIQTQLIQVTAACLYWACTLSTHWQRQVILSAEDDRTANRNYLPGITLRGPSAGSKGGIDARIRK